MLVVKILFKVDRSPNSSIISQISPPADSKIPFCHSYSILAHRPLGRFAIFAHINFTISACQIYHFTILNTPTMFPIYRFTISGPTGFRFTILRPVGFTIYQFRALSALTFYLVYHF